MRGAMFERMKKLRRGRSRVPQGAGADPENAGALNYLGYMLADRDVRLDEAQKLSQSRGTGSAEWRVSGQPGLGLLPPEPAGRGRRLPAEGAAKDRSTDPTVHDHLGDVYFKQGKIREAIAQWQSSLKEFEANSSQSDADPGEMAKVSKKLESARVRVAKEESLGKDKQQ